MYTTHLAINLMITWEFIYKNYNESIYFTNMGNQRYSWNDVYSGSYIFCNVLVYTSPASSLTAQSNSSIHTTLLCIVNANGLSTDLSVSAWWSRFCSAVWPTWYKFFTKSWTSCVNDAGRPATREWKDIFTARNEVGARFYFYTCLWFCSHGGGVCPIACWDTHTQTPGPEAGTPLWTRHPLHPPGTRHPPVQCMLGDTGNKRAVRILLECNLVKIGKACVTNLRGLFEEKKKWLR